VLPVPIAISQLKRHMKLKFLFKPGKSAAETLISLGVVYGNW
jgi:hypothetical protein